MPEESTNIEGQAAPADTDASAPEAAQTPRADLGKRFLAALIDAVITVVISFVPLVGGLAASAYWLVRDGMELEFMDRRSIGKKVMKLRPVTLDGSPMDLVTSAKRNWIFAIGGIAQLFAVTIIGIVIAIPLAMAAIALGLIEIVLVLTDPEGRRLGDKWAGTKVIETSS